MTKLELSLDSKPRNLKCFGRYFMLRGSCNPLCCKAQVSGFSYCLEDGEQNVCKAATLGLKTMTQDGCNSQFCLGLRCCHFIQILRKEARGHPAQTCILKSIRQCHYMFSPQNLYCCFSFCHCHLLILVTPVSFCYFPY
jgi:hypothetical protein